MSHPSNLSETSTDVMIVVLLLRLPQVSVLIWHHLQLPVGVSPNYTFGSQKGRLQSKSERMPATPPSPLVPSSNGESDMGATAEDSSKSASPSDTSSDMSASAGVRSGSSCCSGRRSRSSPRHLVLGFFAARSALPAGACLGQDRGSRWLGVPEMEARASDLRGLPRFALVGVAVTAVASDLGALPRPRFAPGVALAGVAAPVLDLGGLPRGFAGAGAVSASVLRGLPRGFAAVVAPADLGGLPRPRLGSAVAATAFLGAAVFLVATVSLGAAAFRGDGAGTAKAANLEDLFVIRPSNVAALGFLLPVGRPRGIPFLLSFLTFSSWTG